MKKNRNMKLAAGAMLFAGMAMPALGADAITFDADGLGGDAAVANVLSFDWSPGNTLAVGGNAAVQTFLASAQGVHNIVDSVTNVFIRFEITAPGVSPTVGVGEKISTSQFGGGVSNPFSVFYQAKLAGLNLQGGLPGSPFKPAGLNSTYELTAVARFDERVTSILVDNVAGSTTVNFAHSTNANEYLEIYHGTGATFNASDLLGTGFNDGARILESDILATTFISNFAGVPGTVIFDQANGNNYLGQLSTVGSGTTRFDGAVTGFDSTFFVDVLSVVGFTDSTNGNQKLPFEEAEPSAKFLAGSAGTALAFIPVAAGAGLPGDPILGIGTINGGVIGAGGGNSIQFQADVNSSFERVNRVVVPEPATAALGLMGLAGLAFGRRRRA